MHLNKKRGMGGVMFFSPLQNIHAYQHRFFANRLMRYNAALAQKPAEIAFMYSNQALAHHGVASVLCMLPHWQCFLSYYIES